MSSPGSSIFLFSSLSSSLRNFCKAPSPKIKPWFNTFIYLYICQKWIKPRERERKQAQIIWHIESYEKRNSQGALPVSTLIHSLKQRNEGNPQAFQFPHRFRLEWDCRQKEVENNQICLLNPVQRCWQFWPSHYIPCKAKGKDEHQH